MKNIFNRDELLSLDNALSITKKKMTPSIILLILGIFSIYAGIKELMPEVLNYLFLVGGLTFIIIAIGQLLTKSNNITHTLFDETLHMKRLYFDIKDEKEIKKLISSGNIKALINKSHPTGQLLAIIYCTTHYHYYIAQIFRFIPYEYRPHIDPIIFNIDPQS